MRHGPSRRQSASIASVEIMSHLPQSLSRADEIALTRACERLEYPGFAARLSELIGAPLEMTLKLLPRAWYLNVRHSAEVCVFKALNVAVAGIRRRNGNYRSDAYYKALGMASGAVGGLVGGPALLLEMPITTTIMLGAIADIARQEGENLDSLEARLACLQVFALGGRGGNRNVIETGYYGLRLALELPMANLTGLALRESLALRGNPPVVAQLISTISERFGVALSEKTVAEIVPVVGAVGGAFINGAFIQHFQDTARGHFVVRRLERKYNPELIRAAYERIDKSRREEVSGYLPRRLSPSEGAA